MPERRKNIGRSAKRSSRVDYEQALRLAQTDRDANLPQILALLRRAVAAGYGPAQYALATWYLFGVGVRKNLSQGAVLLRKAVAKGVAAAAFDLAVSYELASAYRRIPARHFSFIRRRRVSGITNPSTRSVGATIGVSVFIEIDRALSSGCLEHASTR
jgi:hypothetical protein